MNTIGIYIHIPFCIKKCPYCSFNSIEKSEIQEDLYINALLNEFAYCFQERPELYGRVLQTIYFGGGTPSLISPEGIDRLIRGITFSCLPLNKGGGASPLREVTIEVNPGTVTLEKLRLFKEAGINRLSIGVQSFNEERLRTLGRIHTVRDSLKCYEDSRNAVFNNVGIDLISCIPGQTPADWSTEIDKAISLRPEHISGYTLTLEKGTQFFRLHKEGNLLLPTEEEQAMMFELTMDNLACAGYNHYEISNYSLEGFESRHNNRYWHSMDYIGLGAGAHSYLASSPSSHDWGVRWWNDAPPDSYINSINKVGRAIKEMEILTKEEAVTEALFLGLRKKSGIDYDWFSGRFDYSLKESSGNKIDQLIADGFLFEEDKNLILTRKGILVTESVIMALI